MPRAVPGGWFSTCNTKTYDSAGTNHVPDDGMHRRAQLALRAALFAVDFFAVDFFAVDFLAADFFAVDFLAADFLAVDFWAPDFFAVDFWAPDFFADARPPL